jgi:hypothetical protein
LPDDDTYTDRVNLASANGRQRFVAGLKAKGITKNLRAQIAAALEKEAAQLQELKGSDQARASQADVLARLAFGAGVKLFHTPGGHDSEAYASIQANDHKETWPIGSKAFRDYLGRLYYTDTKKVPNSQSLQDACNVLAGHARYEGPEHAVHVRLAEYKGAIYLDLADEKWRAVRITADGWAVVKNPSVKFLRKRGMLALPKPERGGNLDELLKLVNLPAGPSRQLFLAWLVAAMRPGLPFPLLIAKGEQGSAKSTLCKMARSIIDPNFAALRSLPRREEDLVIAANNGWVIGFDNVSTINEDMSDALCRLATGGGLGKRQLYTDDEEKLFNVQRPVILNSIGEPIWRVDLLDRSIPLELPFIPPEKRRDESKLWRRFRNALPRILGALLDVVSAALKQLPHVKLDTLPRMADFALWLTAAERALGWEPGTFMNAYRWGMGQADEQVLEGSLIVTPLLAFLARKPTWEGTASELLEHLRGKADPQALDDRHWPKQPNGLSCALRRIAPVLRRARNIDVTLTREAGSGTRLIRLEQTCKPSSQTVTSSRRRNGDRAIGDGVAMRDDGLHTQSGGKRACDPNNNGWGEV